MNNGDGSIGGECEPGSENVFDQRQSSPIALSRILLATVRELGGKSISYHVAARQASLKSTLPYMFFTGDKNFSRHQLPAHHSEVIGRCHEFVVTLGRPIILTDFLPKFAKIEPELTTVIMDSVHELGVFDQYIIPVFGAYNTNGVMAVGFGQTLNKDRVALFGQLETLAATFHTRMVRHFGSGKRDIDLSPRENDVLRWIAAGKSRADIATILAIKPSSVDTYTRRIFEKMGVNDRVSAAVSGLAQGLFFRE